MNINKRDKKEKEEEEEKGNKIKDKMVGGVKDENGNNKRDNKRDNESIINCVYE